MTTKICPKCGKDNVYIGVTTVECGYDPKCENYTERQHNEVMKLISKKYPCASPDYDEYSEYDAYRDNDEWTDAYETYMFDTSD